VQELKGEKIDIVPYSPDLARFVCNAIAPAEVARVLIDEDTNTIELIVPDDQLSLAIGRRGQNVKLASQLVGWNIEIHSESQIAELKDDILEALSAAEVMDPMDIEYMFKLGLHSVENILGTPDDELASLPGISEDALPKIREVLEELQERRIRQKEEEARRANEPRPPVVETEESGEEDEVVEAAVVIAPPLPEGEEELAEIPVQAEVIAPPPVEEEAPVEVEEAVEEVAEAAEEDDGEELPDADGDGK